MYNLSNEVENLEVRIKQLENLLVTSQYDMKRIATTTLNDRTFTISQSEQMFGLYMALCIETQDVWKQNRIRFFSPLFHDPKKPLHYYLPH